MNVAVAYDFDFDITEENQADAGAAFKLPLISSAIDAGASASMHLKRQGKRTFKAQNQWSGLVVNADRCTDFARWGQNPVYPLGGSIGVGRVVATYMDLIDPKRKFRPNNRGHLSRLPQPSIQAPLCGYRRSRGR